MEAAALSALFSGAGAAGAGAAGAGAATGAGALGSTLAATAAAPMVGAAIPASTLGAGGASMGSWLTALGKGITMGQTIKTLLGPSNSGGTPQTPAMPQPAIPPSQPQPGIQYTPTASTIADMMFNRRQ